MGLETENHILTLGLDPEEWWEVWRCEGIKGKQLITHYVGRDSAAEELLVCDPLSPDSDVVFFGYSFIQYPLGTHRDCSVCWVLAAKLLSQIAKHVWFHAGYLQHYNQAMNTSQPIQITCKTVNNNLFSNGLASYQLPSRYHWPLSGPAAATMGEHSPPAQQKTSGTPWLRHCFGLCCDAASKLGQPAPLQSLLTPASASVIASTRTSLW